MADDRDILYAWMLPYYAIVRRTSPSVMKENRDAQWQALAVEINVQTERRHSALLKDISKAGRGAEAAEVLQRIWERSGL